MVIVPPYDQFGGTATVTTPATGFQWNFINVVTPTAQRSQLLLDGAPLPDSVFTPIGNSGFSGAQIAVNVGSHTLSGAAPFGATAYGYDNDDGYGYTGAVCLATAKDGSTVELTPKQPSTAVGGQSCISVKVTDNTGAPISGAGVTLTISGVDSITAFLTTDAT